MLKQNHPHLHHAIRLSGCNFRSLQAIAECLTGHSLSAQQINAAYHDLIQDPQVLSPTCLCGPRLHQIILRALHDCGARGHAHQVGSVIAGRRSYWGGFSQHNFSVLHWNTPYPSGHFTLADADMHEIFDPHDPQLGGILHKYSIRKILLYHVVLS